MPVEQVARVRHQGGHQVPHSQHSLRPPPAPQPPRQPLPVHQLGPADAAPRLPVLPPVHGEQGERVCTAPYVSCHASCSHHPEAPLPSPAELRSRRAQCPAHPDLEVCEHSGPMEQGGLPEILEVRGVSPCAVGRAGDGNNEDSQRMQQMPLIGPTKIEVCCPRPPLLLLLLLPLPLPPSLFSLLLEERSVEDEGSRQRQVHAPPPPPQLPHSDADPHQNPVAPLHHLDAPPVRKHLLARCVLVHSDGPSCTPPGRWETRLPQQAAALSREPHEVLCEDELAPFHLHRQDMLLSRSKQRGHVPAPAYLVRIEPAASSGAQRDPLGEEESGIGKHLYLELLLLPPPAGAADNKPQAEFLSDCRSLS
eukprot:760508-Hanusia_phi.AAC.1